ncbi:DUF222 domain-containing protein, partial [Lysobacter korlensis]
MHRADRDDGCADRGGHLRVPRAADLGARLPGARRRPAWVRGAGVGRGAEVEHRPVEGQAARHSAAADPEAAIERHRAAVERRDVWVDPAADGMAILSALLPAATAVAAADRIEEYARGITGDPHETRTVPQVRADVFAEFVLGGEAGAWRITPTVQVVVPALSLLGHSEELAILDGYGPIDL